jgi:transcriptional regulator with XRE-family HTH domain
MSLEVVDWQTGSSARPERPELPALARRLRHERESRGITQAEAVQVLHVPQATYAGWETGRATPGPQAFARLAAFLGLAEGDVEALCASPFVVDTSGWPAFGQLTGARREELRMSRADLAEALGVSVRSVVAWELGYRVPGSTQLARLARVLEVDMGSLAASLPRRWAGSTLGELIQVRRRELGLRSIDLARMVGTTEATVSRWVNGRSRPGSQNLRRLAEVLQVPHARVVEAAGSV